MPVDKAGVGSAVLNSSRQLGGSIGIALMGAIMAHEIGGRSTPAAFVHGLSVSLEVGAAVAVVGVLVAAVLVRPHVDRGAPGAHYPGAQPGRPAGERASVSRPPSSAEAQA